MGRQQPPGPGSSARVFLSRTFLSFKSLIPMQGSLVRVQKQLPSRLWRACPVAVIGLG